MLRTLKSLFRKKKSANRRPQATRRSFRPTIDALEDRRMMAVLFVDDDLQQFPAAKYTSIQAAVNAAQPGDIIQVFAGKYNEAVNIPANKSRLTIAGATTGPTFATNPKFASIVDPPTAGTGYGFLVQANDTVIRGFTIGDLDNDRASSTGIVTRPAISGYTIAGNVITGNTYGIDVGANGAKTSFITGNWIYNNNEAGGGSGNGMYSDQGAHNVQVVGNFICDQNNAAVLFTGTGPATNSKLTINNNIIGDATRQWSGSQILLVNTVNSSVSYNQILNSAYHAIALGGGVNTTVISGNTILNARNSGINVNAVYGAAQYSLQITGNFINGAGDSGIRLRAGTYNSIVSSNVVTGVTGLTTPGTGNGISIEDSSNNQVLANSIFNNANNGLLVTGASVGNQLLANAAVGNGNGLTSFDLADLTIGPLNVWLANSALTRNKPGI